MAIDGHVRSTCAADDGARVPLYQPVWAGTLLSVPLSIAGECHLINRQPLRWATESTGLVNERILRSCAVAGRAEGRCRVDWGNVRLFDCHVGGLLREM